MKHAVYVPASNRKVTGWIAGLVIIAAALVIVAWPKPSHAATDPQKPRAKLAAATATVTITGVTAITISGTTITVTGTAMRITPKR